MSNELQTIPINSLYEPPENSRHVFDERKLKELAQSIEAQGHQVRLIVRQGEDASEIASLVIQSLASRWIPSWMGAPGVL